MPNSKLLAKLTASLLLILLQACATSPSDWKIEPSQPTVILQCDWVKPITVSSTMLDDYDKIQLDPEYKAKYPAFWVGFSDLGTQVFHHNEKYLAFTPPAQTETK